MAGNQQWGCSTESCRTIALRCLHEASCHTLRWGVRRKPRGAERLLACDTWKRGAAKSLTPRAPAGRCQIKFATSSAPAMCGILAGGDFASIHLNHQKCARAIMWLSFRVMCHPILVKVTIERESRAGRIMCDAAIVGQIAAVKACATIATTMARRPAVATISSPLAMGQETLTSSDLYPY
jgi:hypothetical protein